MIRSMNRLRSRRPKNQVLRKRRLPFEPLEERRVLTVILQPTTGTVTENVVTGENYYDSGGPGGNYSNNEDGILTLSSGEGVLEVDFTSFSTEPIVDRLEIFDGPSTTDPSFGTFSGGGSPGTIFAAGSDLTFEFISDPGVTAAGWVTDITVHPIDLVVDGTGGDDVIEIRDAGGDLEVLINGSPASILPYGTSPFSTLFLETIDVNGLGGDDTLIVDFNQGQPSTHFLDSTLTAVPARMNWSCRGTATPRSPRGPAARFPTPARSLSVSIPRSPTPAWNRSRSAARRG